MPRLPDKDASRLLPIVKSSRLKFFKPELTHTAKGDLDFANATQDEIIEKFKSEATRVNRDQLRTYESLLKHPERLLREISLNDTSNLISAVNSINPLQVADKRPKYRVQTFIGGSERYPLATAAYIAPALELAQKIKEADYPVDVDILFMKNASGNTNGLDIGKVDDEIRQTAGFMQHLINRSGYAPLRNDIHFGTDDFNYGALKSQASNEQVQKVLKYLTDNPSLLNVYLEMVQNNQSELFNSLRYAQMHYLFQDSMQENSFRNLRNNIPIPNADPETTYLQVGAMPEKVFYTLRQAYKRGADEPAKKTVQYISNFKRAPYMEVRDAPDVFIDDYMKHQEQYDEELQQASARKHAEHSKYSIPTIQAYEMIAGAFGKPEKTNRVKPLGTERS